MTLLGVDAEAVAAAVGRCACVAQLSTGEGGRIRTLLPGRQVDGVRVTADAVEIHVVAHFGPTVAAIGAQVAAAAAPLADGRDLRVHVEDLLLPQDGADGRPPRVIDLSSSEHRTQPGGRAG